MRTILLGLLSVFFLTVAQPAQAVNQVLSPKIVSVTANPSQARAGQAVGFTIVTANVQESFVNLTVIPSAGRAFAVGGRAFQTATNTYYVTLDMPSSYTPGACGLEVAVFTPTVPIIFKSGIDFIASFSIIAPPLPPLPAAVTIGMKAKTEKIVYKTTEQIIVTIDVDNSKLNNSAVAPQSVVYELYRLTQDESTRQVRQGVLVGSGAFTLVPFMQNGVLALVVPGEASATIAGGEAFGNINSWVSAPFNSNFPRPEGLYSMQIRFTGKKINNDVVTGTTSTGFKIER